MDIKTDVMSPDLFLALYASAGWEPPCREQVERALENTLATFVAYDGQKPVGMVRLLGDGGMSFYVKDFAVLPDCQGRGVGKALMEAVKAYILGHIEAGWAVSLELISTREAVPFYKSQGFRERPCDWDGPGMFQMIWRERK